MRNIGKQLRQVIREELERHLAETEDFGGGADFGGYDTGDRAPEKREGTSIVAVHPSNAKAPHAIKRFAMAKYNENNPSRMAIGAELQDEMRDDQHQVEIRWVKRSSNRR